MRSALASVAVSVTAALLALGCIKVKAAPESLDTALKSYWSAYDKGSDADITALTKELDKLVPDFVAASENPGVLEVRGRIGLLDKELLAAIGMQDKGNPAEALGVVIFTEIACPLDKVEKYAVARNQLELYPEVYVKYDRVYTNNDADYFARKIPHLTWKTDYRSDVLGKATYDATILGDARWIPGKAGASGPEGAVLLSRSYFPAPAKVVQPEKSWNQDYQMEVYYEREPGKTVHLYALWRDFDLGYTMKEDSAVNFVLANLIEFDNRTAKICAAGTPLPK